MYVSHCPVEGSYLKVIFVIQKKKKGDGCVTAILETFIWRKSLGSNSGLRNRTNQWNMSKPIASAILKTQTHPCLAFPSMGNEGLGSIFHFREQAASIIQGLIAPNAAHKCTTSRSLFIYRCCRSLLIEKSFINITISYHFGA